MTIKEAYAERKRELEEIAAICAKILQDGASSFREALQTFWFIHLLEGNDSPGRFDQYMYQYYNRDVGNSIITQREVQSLLDHLWKRFNDVCS